MKKNIWNGTYKQWDDAPNNSGIFESDIWLDNITDTAKKMCSRYETHDAAFPVNVALDYALPLVAGMAMPADRSLCIIDYGGGLAASYFSLVAATQGVVDFHIVETEEVCRRGRELFGGIDGLTFQSTFPTQVGFVDIIHAGSSLQYVEDYEEMLSKFASFEPQYLVLADVLAGNINSFVTTQDYYGKTIRVRFLNLNELLSAASKVGFTLIYQSSFSAPIKGKAGRLPMSNFRKGYKLDYPCQLVFRWSTP